jgi:hypothetical protein
MTGIYVTRGMVLRIPAGGLVLSVNPSGGVDSSIRFEVSLDMTPYWLEIALNHLIAADAARRDLLRVMGDDTSPEKAQALEREFTSGMQALVASVTALEALYSTVRENIGIPDSLVKTWREKRTARHRQVCEVFRRAFAVKGQGLKNLKQILGELYEFRDLAVHPPGKFSNPVLHEVLGAGTEWRFVSFGYDSARTSVRAALSVVSQLADRPREQQGSFYDYRMGLSERIKPLQDEWATHFGPLNEHSTDSNGADSRI